MDCWQLLCSNSTTLFTHKYSLQKREPEGRCPHTRKAHPGPLPKSPFPSPVTHLLAVLFCLFVDIEIRRSLKYSVTLL